MRKLALFVAAALVFAACSSGSDSSEPATTTTQEASAQAAGGGSGFCGAVENVIGDLDKIDTEDPNLDIESMYALVLKVYKQLSDAAPSDLQDEFALMLDTSERLNDWAKDPTGDFPLTEEESNALDEASTRIDAYILEECGINTAEEIDPQFASDSGDTDVVTGTDKDPENPIDANGQYQATQTITLGGETYTETLGDMFEVSCDMYGDLETGSIGIYLSGPEFESSVSSYDTGVEPGTYEGRIWVFANDPDLDELTWDLQEIDGTFVLDRAQRVTDDEWLFSGSFSATAENDPATSIEAEFTCVGPVGF